MIAETQVSPVNFVLSAGRTGTVFLTNLFEQLNDVHVAHEPFPARYELMLANMRNDLGVGDSLIRKLFLSTRKRRFAESSQAEKYIEINPLMCPLVDLLKELERPVHVVHMIREPLSWVKSITAFRASRFVRPFYPLIPFSTPFPSPRPAGWQRLSHIERQLWRWRFCNEQIIAQKSHFSRYALVRYEDLFSDEEKTRLESLKRICETLQIPMDSIDPSRAFGDRKNPSPPRPLVSVEKETVGHICGELASQLGYA